MKRIEIQNKKNKNKRFHPKSKLTHQMPLELFNTSNILFSILILLIKIL